MEKIITRRTSLRVMLSVFMIVFLLAAGALFTMWTVRRADHDMRSDLLLSTRLLAQALKVDQVQALSGTKADLDSPAYQRIKEQLTTMRFANPLYRFIYILGRQADGTISILVDDQDTNSPDYSPPGQVYEEASAEISRVFSTQIEACEGPVTDRWGSWVSGLVPLFDVGTEVAVLGIDVDARTWQTELVKAALPPVLCTLILVAIALLASMLLAKRSRHLGRRARWMTYLEPGLVACVGLSLTLFAAWMAHRAESRERHNAFVQLALSQTEPMAGRIANIRDIELESFAYFYENNAEVSAEEFKQFTTYLLNNSAVSAWEWMPAVAAQDKARFESAARESGLQDFEIWQRDAQGKRIPASQRPVYYPVLRIAPLTGNEYLLGLDPSSTQLSLKAIEQAKRTGLATASETVTPVVNMGGQKWMAVHRPIFAKDGSGRLLGFVAAVLRMSSLLRTGVTDGSALLELSLLHRDAAPEPLATTWGTDSLPASERHSLLRPVFAFGKVFGVTVQAGQAFMTTHPQRAAWQTLLLGLGLTLALAIILHANRQVILRRNEELERLVDERTLDLQESEASYRNQFVANSSVMLLIDPSDGAILDANSAAFSFYGYPREQFLAMRITDINTLPAAEVQRDMASVSPGEGQHFEFVHRLADGSLRHVAVSSSSIQFSGRSVLHSIVYDITERKNIENELKMTAKRLSLAVRAGGVGIWDFDIVNNRLFWDEQMYRLYGITSEQFDGTYETWKAGVHPDDVLRSDAEIQMAIRGEKEFDTTFRVVWKDGSIHSIRALAIVQRDSFGQALNMIGTNWDITAQKQNEEALRESQERFRQLAEVFPETIFETDVSGRLTYANEHGFRTYGYTPADMDRGINVFDMVVAQERAQVMQRVQNRIEGKTGGFLEYQALRKDGSTFAALAYSSSIVRQGQVTGIRGFILDITVRKQTEEELLWMNRNLEESTARANELAHQAQMASRAKSEFLANMSHEIRTPMNGVIGMTSLLLDTGLDEKQRLFANAIRSSGESLLSILNDILDFSKIEAGKLDLEILNFDLRDLLDEFASLMALRAKEKGLEFTCEAAPEIPNHLGGDPGRLRQILTNLVGNAIKFTPSGKVSVRVDLQDEDKSQAEANNLSPRSDQESVLLRFTVQDTGIGVPLDKQHLLFQKFTQMDGSTTRQYGGTGLGLAISKQLAEMMGGQIGIVSQIGQGSEFWFTARLTRQVDGKPTPTLLPQPSHPGIRLGTARILLAEDNITNQQVAIGILNNLGLHADVVGDGAQAVEALKTMQYDLVLMDVQMPVMDGFEATRKIRKMINDSSLITPHSSLPIIALTAHAIRGDREKCLEAGMNDYMTKPISAQDMAQVLNKWLPKETPAPSKQVQEVPKETGNVMAKGPDLPVFDKLGMMTRLMGDKELVRKLITGFLADMPKQVEKLRSYLKTGDRSGATRQAHTIKGASANLGGERLRALAAEMEKAGQAGNLENITTLLPELEDRLAQLMQAMTNWPRMENDEES